MRVAARQPQLLDSSARWFLLGEMNAKAPAIVHRITWHERSLVEAVQP
jgi:hypothetical protein